MDAIKSVINRWLCDRYNCTVVIYLVSLRIKNLGNVIDITIDNDCVIIDLFRCSGFSSYPDSRQSVSRLFFNSPSFFDDLAVICDRYLLNTDADGRGF